MGDDVIALEREGELHRIPGRQEMRTQGDAADNRGEGHGQPEDEIAPGHRDVDGVRRHAEG